MGLDVANGLFGNFHLNGAGTRWFSHWCDEHGLPGPFIGWESGMNNGDLCDFDRDEQAVRLARDWCDALEWQFPEIAKLGKILKANPTLDLHIYLYPHAAMKYGTTLSEKEWGRRAVAAWYAILRHGIEHGGTLEYW